MNGTMRRVTVLLSSVVVLTAGGLFATWLYWEGPLIFTTQKVCQVTGDWDEERSQPTINHNKGFGITGSDLGYPVPWNDRLYFLFGDTRSEDPEQLDWPPRGADSMATGPLNADIDREGCISLDFFTDQPGVFRPIRLAEKGKWLRELGVFETPVSGFGNGGSLFVFFTVRDNPQGCTDALGCAIADDEPGGQTKLAMSTDGGGKFAEIAVVSKAKFQWPVPVIAQANQVPGLPSHLTGPVVLIWGTGRQNHKFRYGYPFLAVAPLSSIGWMESWWYFVGIGRDDRAVWKQGETNAEPLPPFGSPRYVQSLRFGSDYHKCLGEISVGRIAEWKKWVMLYACDDNPELGYNPENDRGIFLRTSDTPWGPWSEPLLIFRPNDGYCHFIHSKDPCPANTPNAGDNGMQERDKQGNLTGRGQMWGAFYAPLFLPSYTKVEGDSTTLYFLMSTWNPYQTVLMRTRVRPRSVWTRFFPFLARKQEKG